PRAGRRNDRLGLARDEASILHGARDKAGTSEAPDTRLPTEERKLDAVAGHIQEINDGLRHIRRLIVFANLLPELGRIRRQLVNRDLPQPLVTLREHERSSTSLERCTISVENRFADPPNGERYLVLFRGEDRTGRETHEVARVREQ